MHRLSTASPRNLDSLSPTSRRRTSLAMVDIGAAVVLFISFPIGDPATTAAGVGTAISMGLIGRSGTGRDLRGSQLRHLSSLIEWSGLRVIWRNQRVYA